MPNLKSRAHQIANHLKISLPVGAVGYIGPY